MIEEGPVARDGGRRTKGMSVYRVTPTGTCWSSSRTRRGRASCRADVVIRGGPVVDGTGAPARSPTSRSPTTDSRVGPNLHGDVELDASGCVVAPGFIDIHTHYDAQVFWDPRLRPSSYHGITTVIAGNCGFAIAPTRPISRRHRAHARKRRGHGPRDAHRGRRLGLRDLPRILGCSAAAWHHTQLHRVRRPLAAPALCDGRRGL